MKDVIHFSRHSFNMNVWIEIKTLKHVKWYKSTLTFVAVHAGESFDMKINFICNYMNTWKHIFWLYNNKYITKWYCVYLPRLSCFAGDVLKNERKESWLMSLASPENEQFPMCLYLFVSLALVRSCVMNVWFEIYCSLYEFQQTIFKWMNS